MKRLVVVVPYTLNAAIGSVRIAGKAIASDVDAAPTIAAAIALVAATAFARG